MAQVFISYSSVNKRFARRLAGSLRHAGHNVWLDEWNIRVGDSIPAKIGMGIDDADYVAVVLSEQSVKSGWVESEWQTKYWEEISKRRVSVLPVLLNDCIVPPLLQRKKYADFRRHYESGLIELTQAMGHPPNTEGIKRFYTDFVDIEADWVNLFKHTKDLDVLCMYSETWRNTYLKYLRAIIVNGGRIRLIIPDFETSPTRLAWSSERFGMTPSQLRDRTTQAVTAYAALGKNVFVYATSAQFTHASYLFDSEGILALYSYRTERVPTPAIWACEGDLLSFLRADFTFLLRSKRTRQLYPASRRPRR